MNEKKSKFTEIIEKIKEKARKMNTLDNQKEYFDNLKPFESIDNIPDIPIIEDPEKYKEIVVKNLIRCGAISKDSLVVGAKYEGACRNASRAVWNGTEFEIKRYKFGRWEDDTLNHFEDDDGYDVFIPLKKVEENQNNI